MIGVQGTYGPEIKFAYHGDGVIGRALESGEPYEAKLLYHIYRREFTGRAVDVGAHFGNHTLWFAVACGLKVHAFEPSEFRHLCENLQANNVNGNVVPSLCALGDHDTVASPVGEGRIVYDMNGNIPVRKLDNYVLSDVSLIKIDVEGWEPYVIRGARETIQRCKPVIYAEARDDAALLRNNRELADLGYQHTGKTFGATPMLEYEHVS